MIQIFVLSERGAETAQQLKCLLEGAEVVGLYGRVAECDRTITSVVDAVQTAFKTGTPIIGLCASGILIRALAPLLTDKWQEPPVLAVAEDGSTVVPLLGGHHGANDIACQIADGLDCVAAITTSGDLHYGIALDNPPKGYHLANPSDAKGFMARLLAGETIQLEGEADWLSESRLPFADEGTLRISVTCGALQGDETHLVYHPKVLALGMGAERDAPSDEAITLASDALAGLSPHALAALVSVDLKADEAALHDVAAHFGVPYRTFSKDALLAQEPRLHTPSQIVKAEIGLAGVAEAAALAAVGDNGSLIVDKIKAKRSTAALARAPSPIGTIGAPRGHVSLIGIGPGEDKWRSPEATQLLQQASDWVGYDLYLDLVADVRRGQAEHRFPLGAEEDRVRFAMELAAKGKDVAVVCSGDAGIYAMATLAYELLDTGAAGGALSDAAKRVGVTVAPGISAFQAAAAKIGAPIGHDFCCISLSDLLTPRASILQRLEAAAQGDFVISFYNPRSKRRVDLLDKAFDILRAHRPADTPVLLATDLGRPAENVRLFTLETVRSEDVDMLTLVMVGSSASRVVKTGDGGQWMYTPRGYNNKDLGA